MANPRQNKATVPFVPNPLPPEIQWSDSLVRALSEADRLIGRLAGQEAYLPNPHVLLRPFVRREAIRYGWNYALLLAKGPCDEALVPSPVMRAMREGKLARVEELTRIPADVQDALITILSEKTLPVAELDSEVQGVRGFNVIATANNRDRGVNELSSALSRASSTSPTFAESQAGERGEKVAAEGAGFLANVVGEDVLTDVLMNAAGGDGTALSGDVGGEGLAEPGLAHFAVEEIDEGLIGRGGRAAVGFDDLKLNGAAEDARGVTSEGFEHVEQLTFFLGGGGGLIAGDAHGHAEDFRVDHPILERKILGEEGEGGDAKKSAALRVSRGAVRRVDDELVGGEFDASFGLVLGEDSWAVEFVESDAVEIHGSEIDGAELAAQHVPDDFDDGDVSSDGEGEVLERFIEGVEIGEDLAAVFGGGVGARAVDGGVSVGSADDSPIEAGEGKSAGVGDGVQVGVLFLHFLEELHGRGEGAVVGFAENRGESGRREAGAGIVADGVLFSRKDYAVGRGFRRAVPNGVDDSFHEVHGKLLFLIADCRFPIAD